ncbi:hypothetical protein NL676_023810 [Syzygium grande]|nr:hypothetical protein NL676_023810 [Syzygium grande]
MAQIPKALIEFSSQVLLTSSPVFLVHSVLLAHGVLLLFVRVSPFFFSVESSSHNYSMRPTTNVKSSSSEPDGMNEGVKIPFSCILLSSPWRYGNSF